MSSLEKKPAVFLDRDGVLTEERGYILSAQDLIIFPYTEECIRKIHEKNYYAIVVTNQSGVARGLFSEETLCEINEYLIEQTGVDAVYYCPHHEAGIVEQYRKKCECRKPQIGLLRQACDKYDIDMERSYMVGDRMSDIIAGQNAGVKTVLVESGYGTAEQMKDAAPDYILNDLRDVVEIL